MWYAPDHLLLVEAIFFKERYRRFYYKDIQSIVMHRTGLHWVWTGVWGAIALLFGVIAYLVSGTPYVSSTIMAFALAALLMNLLMGSCCRVFLQTAVQRQRLSTLRRVRSAAKAINRIKAFVEEQQGGWEKQKSVDTHKAQKAPGPVAAQGVPMPSPVDTEEKAPAGPFKPLLHRILFGLLCVMGVLGAGQIFLKNLPLGLLASLMHAIAQILVIITLARWFRHIKATMIAKINWLALIFIAIHSAAGYILYFAVSFRHPEINYHNWALFQRMFELQMTDHPLAFYGNIIYAAGTLLLGFFGMLVVQKFAGRSKS